jgi:hypothetical protein
MTRKEKIEHLIKELSTDKRDMWQIHRDMPEIYKHLLEVILLENISKADIIKILKKERNKSE